MISFFVIAAAFTALAMGFVLRALWRPRVPAGHPSQRAANAAIHAEALAFLDADREAGLLMAQAHVAARDELLRRVLAEDAREVQPGVRAARWREAALVLSIPVVACLLYLAVGDPAALQASAAVNSARQAQRLSLTTEQELEIHLRAAPGDGRAWVLLARLRMNADSFASAAQAYERALEANAKVAADPQVWCEFADALGMAQGGVLAGRPRQLIEKALALKPDHPRALEMAGSAAYEAADYPATARYWSAVLAQLRPDTAEHRELQLALERVRARLSGGTGGAGGH